MKRFLLICLAALMVLAAGCSNLINTPEAAVKPQTGTGRALISLGAGQSRTLLPDIAAFYYTLTFTAQDETPVEESIAVGDSLSKTVTLEVGTWALQVYGFINEEEADDPANALVKGNVDSIVVPDDGLAPVTVNMEPTAETMETGTGSLAYTIIFPASLFTDTENNIAVLAYSKIGSTEVSPDLVYLIGETVPPDTGPYTASGTIPLDAGYYLTQVYLYDHVNGKDAALTEVAHIYNGAVTVIDHDLSTLPSNAPLVSFDTQGEGMVESRHVPRGGTVPQPAAPVREGHTFGGWHREASGTTPWNFADAADADVVTNDITLYAKWMRSAKAITGFSISNGFFDFPWELQSDGRRKSPVIGDSQQTITRYNFTTNADGGFITINLYVSSESTYDWAFVGHLDNSNTSMTNYYSNRISGTYYADTPFVITIDVPVAGEHFIEIGYGKDGSQNRNQDCAWFEIAGNSGAFQGGIDDEAKTVSVIVPYGTNLESLTPTITVSPGATVSPASGDAQDFSGSVTYTVTAEDDSTVEYTVTVLAPNNAKAITGFSFADPAATGAIDEASRHISVSVPYGTNLGSLAPTITVSPGATVNPASGEAQDFANSAINPVTYTVTAENGDTAEYTVIVTRMGRGLINPEIPTDRKAQIYIEGTPADEPLTLTLTRAETKTLSTVGSNPSWVIDGNPPVSQQDFILYGSRYAVGSHTASLRVVIDGVRYSTELTFTVTE